MQVYCRILHRNRKVELDFYIFNWYILWWTISCYFFLLLFLNYHDYHSSVHGVISWVHRVLWNPFIWKRRNILLTWIDAIHPPYKRVTKSRANAMARASIVCPPICLLSIHKTCFLRNLVFKWIYIKFCPPYLETSFSSFQSLDFWILFIYCFFFFFFWFPFSLTWDPMSSDESENFKKLFLPQQWFFFNQTFSLNFLCGSPHKYFVAF